MDDCVIDLVEQTVINAIKRCDVDHNKTFVKETFRCHLNTLMLSITKKSSGMRESFEPAIVQGGDCP